jgi:glutamine cyclotransferase
VFLNATTLIESAGMYRASAIQMVDVNHADTLVVRKPMGDDKFGEGCDIIGD